MNSTLKTRLLCSAAAALFTCAGTAQAQDQLETVVVSGIRASLTSAQAIKQNADQVVDSITAVDIGALPDRSVAEALQRIPGVQLSRASETSDPVRYGGTGNTVFIRGLSWVQALLNGRDTFSARNGQALSFSDISANLMAAVDVYKNPNAKMIEGGVGGTVDLKTRKPFDQDNRLIAFSADYTGSVLMGQGRPSANALFSDRWNTKIGEVGALLSVDYQDQLNRTNDISMYSIHSHALSTPVPCGTSTCSTVYFPYADGANGQSFRQEKWEQKRVALDLVLQWRPTDKIEVTATGIYSKADPHEDEYDGEFGISQTPGTSTTGTTFDVSKTTFNSQGVMTGGSFANVMPLNPNVLVNNRHNMNADYSLNVKYNPTNDWAFTADFQLGESRATDRSMTVYTNMKNNRFFNYASWGGCTAALAAADGPYAGCNSWGAIVNYFWADAPQMTMTLNENPRHPTVSFSNEAALADKSNYFWSAAMDHVENNFAHDYAYRADGSHTFGGDGLIGLVKSVDFGVRGEYKQAVTRQSGWNWGVLSLQTWNGWTGAPTSDLLAKVRYISSSLPNDTALYNFGQFFGSHMPSLYLPTADFVGSNNSDRILSDNVSTQGNYQSLAQKAGCAADVVEWKCDAIYGSINPQNDNISGGINNQKEETLAGYFVVNFAHDTLLGANIPIDGNVGVRVVNTNQIISNGWLILPTISTSCVVDPSAAVSCDDYNAAQTFSTLPGGAKGGGGRQSLGAVTHDYTDVMPSVDVRAHISDQLQARLAYSQAIVRPDISYTQNFTTVGFNFQSAPNTGSFATTNGRTGTGGNPSLSPMHAQQYDASLEWYFSPSGNLTFAMFHKDLSGYFYADTRAEAITNNGVTETFNITRTYNGKKGKIEGFELGYQQFYDSLPGAWGGIGVQANYTKIYNSGGTNATVNVSNSTVVANAKLALPMEGMSNDSYNFALLYAKYGIDGRLAYNWRSSYLLTSSASNVNQPVYMGNFGALDGSVLYSFLDHYKVGLQATNIMNAKTTFFVGVDNIKAWYMTTETDRKVSLILRATW